MSRYTMLALFGVTTILLAINGKIVATETWLVENFAKINDVLEQEVNSDNFEANIELVKDWLEEEPADDRQLKTALWKLTRLPEVIDNVTSCRRDFSRKLLESCDDGLADGAHQSMLNYPLKRIDRLIESVAYKSVRLCGLLGDRPAMPYTFKMIAYDLIDDTLTSKVPDNDEPEVNMKAVEEMLQNLNGTTGSYSEALQQLLALKTISEDASSCDERGLEIVIKNDLATRGQILSSGYMRRISRLVHHLAVQHSSMCLPIYEGNCLDKLKQLDEQTYRSVLALASSQLLKVEQLNDLIADVNGKRVDEDFTTKLVAKKDRFSKISVARRSDKNKIFHYLRAAATKQDPEKSKFFEKILDQETGQLFVDRGHLEDIYDQFVHRPCYRFFSLLGSEMQILNYIRQLVARESAENDRNDPLNFRMLRSAFNVCEFVFDYRQYYIDEIVDRIEYSA